MSISKLQSILTKVAANKEAFQPMPGGEMPPPPMDPAMQGMDPAMMGAAQGMDPAMMMAEQGMPVDPAMAMAGGAPMPPDPAMAGGMPPEGAMPPGGDMGILPPEILDIIKSEVSNAIKEVLASTDVGGAPKKLSNEERLSAIESKLDSIAGPIGTGSEGPAEMAPEMAAMGAPSGALDKGASIQEEEFTEEDKKEASMYARFKKAMQIKEKK